MFVAVGTRDEIGNAVYDEMLKLRHKIFHERLQWDIPSVSKNAEMEEDMFDTEQTVYVVLGDPVIACCRLIPTTRTTMISALWPDVMGKINPGQDIWELSRFAADKDAGRPVFLAARLLFEAYKFALERKINYYVVITSPAVAKVIRRMGVNINNIPSMDSTIAAGSTRITPGVGAVLESLVDAHKLLPPEMNPLAMLAQSRSGSVVRL